MSTSTTQALDSLGSTQGRAYTCTQAFNARVCFKCLHMACPWDNPVIVSDAPVMGWDALASVAARSAGVRANHGCDRESGVHDGAACFSISCGKLDQATACTHSPCVARFLSLTQNGHAHLNFCTYVRLLFMLSNVFKLASCAEHFCTLAIDIISVFVHCSTSPLEACGRAKSTTTNKGTNMLFTYQRGPLRLDH